MDVEFGDSAFSWSKCSQNYLRFKSVTASLTSGFLSQLFDTEASNILTLFFVPGYILSIYRSLPRVFSLLTSSFVYRTIEN